jgi:thiamine-phosphate pyrophosphorylase
VVAPAGGKCLIARMANNVAATVRLMLVTDDRLVAGRDLVALALAAERGGVTCVQLRLKEAEPRMLVAAARALVDALHVPLLVNDRPDVAVVAGAAGVHLGPGDLPPRLARRVLGTSAVIGVSVGSEGEALAAGDADYWGIGPWSVTTTKGDAGAPLGADGFGRLVRLAGGRPCIAIGGVQPEDIADVRGAGGAGVAVVSGILAAPDPAAAARAYAERLLS